MVLRAGDHVRWTRNDSGRGLINGEHARVLSIGPVNVKLRTQDGREIAMARDDPQLHHLDHAYSSTVHAAQGLTCDRVIAVLDTDRAPADQAMFYVELTRARDNVVLLTDDREALIEALETAPAEELSALKAIGEQFVVPQETAAQRSPPDRDVVLDDSDEGAAQGGGALRRSDPVGSGGLAPGAGRARPRSPFARCPRHPGARLCRVARGRPAGTGRLPQNPRRPRHLRQASRPPPRRGGRVEAAVGADRIRPQGGRRRDPTPPANAGATAGTAEAGTAEAGAGKEGAPRASAGRPRRATAAVVSPCDPAPGRAALPLR